MKEIVNRLHESRQIELAKSILEANGYKVTRSKKLREGVSEPSIEEIQSSVPEYLDSHPYSSDMDVEEVCEEVAENLFDLDYHEMSGDASEEIFNIVSRYLVD